MGLDMYAFKTLAKPSTQVDFADENVTSNAERIFYWRKHPNLHGWMEKLYRKKGGNADMFNCTEVVLDGNDIDDLEKDVVKDNLPVTSGFFFGKSDREDRVNDEAFVKLAREAIAEGFTVYYTSWW